MGEFQLDTSGAVMLPSRLTHPTGWTDLDAFTQGAESQARRELVERLHERGMAADEAHAATAFHRWSPAALAQLIADCEPHVPTEPLAYLPAPPAQLGQQFWARCNWQADLGDDTLMFLREIRA